MSLEHDERVGAACDCGRGAREYRCVECMRLEPVCGGCMIERHAHCPLHWAEKWTGSFFKRVEMSELGLKIYLGHHGAPCSQGVTTRERMRVVDVNGIHFVSVVYCACKSREEKTIQLLRHSLFPASTQCPDLAFTFQVLRDFHELTTVAKTSGHDYMESLHMKTNCWLPSEIKVRVQHGFLGFLFSSRTPKVPTQQFRRISWYWRFLTALQRSGQSYGIDDKAIGRPDGSLAVHCLGCPVPGLNMEDNPCDQYVDSWSLLWKESQLKYQ